MDKQMLADVDAQKLLISGQLVKVREAMALTGLSEPAIRARIRHGVVRTFGTGRPLLLCLPDLIAARGPLPRGARPLQRPSRRQRAYAAQRAADLAWLQEYRAMRAERIGGGGSGDGGS